MTHNGEKFSLAQKMLAAIQARARLIADLKELDANIPATRAADEPSRPGGARSGGKPRGSDDRLREWRQADRKAWAEYRKWEDRRFPIDPTKLFRDPPGMLAARRRFERGQEIARAKEILRLREESHERR